MTTSKNWLGQCPRESRSALLMVVETPNTRMLVKSKILNFLREHCYEDWSQHQSERKFLAI